MLLCCTHISTNQAEFLSKSDHPFAEAVTYRTHKRRTSTPSARFEPAIPAVERQKTYTLDVTVTGIISCNAATSEKSPIEIKLTNYSIVQEFCNNFAVKYHGVQKYNGIILTRGHTYFKEIFIYNP
jgi:hypothetical protein